MNKGHKKLHQFDEHHAELKGFSKYFYLEIFPFLAAQDGHRREALRKSILWGSFIVGIAVVLAIFTYLRGKISLSFFVIAGAVIVNLGLYSWLMKSVRGYTKDSIVGAICSYIGWVFEAEVYRKPDLEILETYRLIPRGFTKNTSSRRALFEDEMSGEAHGAQFRSIEAHFETKSDDNWTTTLRGQIMTLTFPRKFLGQTVVLRDKGLLQSKKFGDMKRVGLVDPVFERIFEAYSTDQVESRYLLDPVFMQKLVDLEQSVDGKKICFGFLGGKLHIVVQTPNRYEAGSMLKPLTAPERTQKILDEIGVIYDIVDTVLKPNS